jgi:hypothetical protein
LRPLLRSLGVTRYACFAPGSPGEWLAGSGLACDPAQLARATGGGVLPAGLAALELRAGARLLARLFLACESSELVRVTQALAPLLEALLCADFRVAERAGGRVDPCWDPAAPLLVATRALDPRGPWCVVGPRGSGRRTLARALLHRAGLDPEDPARLVKGALPPLLAPGTVWIGASEGGVAPERCVRVPPLSARRTELAPILRHLTRPGGQVPLVLADEGLAALWRQDWSTWPELLEGLALLARLAGPITAAEVRQARLARELDYRASRGEVSARELDALLAETRHRSGNPNLARAARWLGWRTETLLQRLPPSSTRE